MNKKRNKLNLLISGSVITAIAITPLILTTNSSLNINKRTNIHESAGFNIETSQTQSSQNEIVFGQFDNFNNIANATEIQLQTPFGNRGLSSNESKTLINSDRFAINFYPDTIGASYSVIIKSLQSIVTTTKPIPISPGVGTGASKGVLSAQLIGNKLWLIVDINQSIIQQPNYQLRMITLEGIETDSPTASTSSNHSININQFFTPPISGEPTQSLVLAPIYQTIGNKTSIVENEIILYQQNAKIKQGTNSNYANITLLKTNDNGTFPVRAPFPQISIPDYPNARLLSTFIFKNSSESYEIGAYHTTGINDASAGLAYSFASDIENSIETIEYGNIGNLNLVDHKNQMAYPKVISTKDGYESFWIYPTATLKSLGSKVFSTKFDAARKPLSISSQPQVLDLGLFANEREIAQISYDINGNFDDGNLYIPIKYKNPEAPESSLPGIVNWRSTTDRDYWGVNNGSIIPFSPIFLPFRRNVNFPTFITPNEAINSAFIKEIDILNNKITYLFNFIDGDNKGKYFKQTRSLQHNNLLNLNYNTKIPNQIVTKVGKNGIESYSTLTNSSEILPRIQEVSWDYIVDTSNNAFKIIDDNLNFDPKNGSLNPFIINTNGVYINGILNLTDSKPKQIRLIQQPAVGFIPLKIDINTKKDFFTSSSNFVNSINNIEPGSIGSSEENSIQITSAYLPNLLSISAIGNDFTGVVQLSFEFLSGDTNMDNPNGIIKVIDLTISGFSAIQMFIAIIVPIAIIVIGSILGLTIYLISKKKKKDMLSALQAGMTLKEKMSGNNNFDNKIILSNNELSNKITKNPNQINKEGHSPKKPSKISK